MAQTAGTLSGHVMGLYIGGTRVAAIKNVSLDFSAGMMNTNNADTGDYESKKPARRSWSASGNGHFQFDAGYNYEALFNALTGKTKVRCVFTTHVADDIDFAGNGYIESLKAAFPDHDASTYDFTIAGETDVYKAVHPAAVPNGSSHTLYLTVISSSQINLGWTNDSTTEDGISIERSTNGYTWAEIHVTAAAATTYNNTGLTTATRYYYRVRAKLGSLYTEYSNIVSAVTL